MLLIGGRPEEEDGEEEIEEEEEEGETEEGERGYFLGRPRFLRV